MIMNAIKEICDWNKAQSEKADAIAFNTKWFIHTVLYANRIYANGQEEYLKFKRRPFSAARLMPSKMCWK